MRAPYQWHSDTSRAAAVSIEPFRYSTKTRVFLALSVRPMTDEEVCDVTEISQSTERPRRVELVQEGAVQDSGMRRKTRSGRNAVVWRIVLDETQLPLFGELA